MPHPILSRLKIQTLRIMMQTLKMNVTTAKCLLANETIITHHVRHIFMPVDKTIKK